MGVFKQGDVFKQMFQKGYKIILRMYLNLCNAKFSRIDVENKVYGEVILSLHFSIFQYDQAPKSLSMHVQTCSQEQQPFLNSSSC